MPSFNDSLIITTQCKATYIFLAWPPYCFIRSTKITLHKGFIFYFYYYAQFQDPILSEASVDSTTDVHMATILVLLTVRSKKYKCGIAFGGTVFVLSFVKISLLIRKLLGEGQADLMS
jgi:hypothetical protein